MNTNTTIIDTGKCAPLGSPSGIIEGREAMARAQQELNGVDVTILVLAFNRVSKTRHCVESILENTKGIRYELLLIDNGSSDDTTAYFESVPYEKKKIIKITKGLGTNFAFCVTSIAELGRYLVFVTNDVVVTPKWLDNLLTCAASDPRIGMVCPAASHSSNLQEVTLEFKDEQEMQKKAGDYNRSDPAKWEERIRLISYTMLLKKETLLAIGYPYFDCGFMHDFGDDDLSFRVRRAGYKAIFAKDVWVHHDHDYRNLEDKDPVQFQKSLEAGRNNFQEKYLGIDAWDDVNNFLLDLKDHIQAPAEKGIPRILGIDVRCGTPILEIKNKLREYGHFDAGLSAFTQDVKYELDLKTICQDLVVCDREEFMRDSFPDNFFDYVVMDRPINRYHEPQKMLNDILRLSKAGAQILFPLYNTYSFYEYLNIMGNWDLYSPSLAYQISFERMEAVLKKTCRVEYTSARCYQLPPEDQELIEKAVRSNPMIRHPKECFNRLMIENYWFVVKKL